MVTSTMQQLTNCSLDYKDQKFLELLDYSSVVVRRMLEQSLIIFLRITATYLNDCTNKDRLLPIALEHLVHLLLFSDEFCLEAIRVSLNIPFAYFSHKIDFFISTNNIVII